MGLDTPIVLAVSNDTRHYINSCSALANALSILLGSMFARMKLKRIDRVLHKR